MIFKFLLQGSQGNIGRAICKRDFLETLGAKLRNRKKVVTLENLLSFIYDQFRQKLLRNEGRENFLLKTPSLDNSFPKKKIHFNLELVKHRSFRLAGKC